MASFNKTKWQLAFWLKTLNKGKKIKIITTPFIFTHGIPSTSLKTRLMKYEFHEKSRAIAFDILMLATRDAILHPVSS